MAAAKFITPGERRAILALMRLTTLTDKQVAEEVGRGHWTVFHIRKAAGIPATNKGRVAGAVMLEPTTPPPDIREHWQSVEPELFRVERSDTPHALPDPYAARRAS